MMSKNYAWKAAIQDTGLGGSRGAGFGDFVRKAARYVKDNKLISRGLSGLSGVLPAQYGAIASKAGDFAANLGLGRRRRRRVVRRSGSKVTKMDVPVGGRRRRAKRGGMNGPNPRGDGRRRKRRS